MAIAVGARLLIDSPSFMHVVPFSGFHCCLLLFSNSLDPQVPNLLRLLIYNTIAPRNSQPLAFMTSHCCFFPVSDILTFQVGTNVFEPPSQSPPQSCSLQSPASDTPLFSRFAFSISSPTLVTSSPLFACCVSKPLKSTQ
jgi:hypothetical protein